jgi:hypothetical protein
MSNSQESAWAILFIIESIIHFILEDDRIKQRMAELLDF